MLSLKTLVFFLSLSLEIGLLVFSSFEPVVALERDFEVFLGLVMSFKSLKILLSLKYSSFQSLKKFTI